MRSIHSFCFLYIVLIALPTPAKPRSASTARRKSHSSPARLKAGSASSSRHAASAVTASAQTKLDRSSDSLRERWVNLLERDSTNKPVRLENEKELQYYYSAELLADKLLGLEDADEELKSSILQKSETSSISNEISLAWKSVALASSGVLLGFPIIVLAMSILSSSAIATFTSSAISSISSLLPDLSSTIPTSISAIQSSIVPYLQSSWIQAQTIVTSLRHVKLGPLLVKIIRKCIILEAWRHIWIRVYKLSRYLWRGTLKNVARLYYRVFPAWIRRGVKNVFQSTVQAHVHGVMGSVAGSMMSGITFESWAWRSSSDGSELFESEGIGGEGIVGSVESTMQEAMSMDDIISDSMSDSAAQSFQSTVQDALDTAVDESMLESVVEAAAEDVIADAFSDSVESSLDSAVDTISDVVDDVMEDVFSDSVEASLESISDCGVDCLIDGALDG